VKITADRLSAGATDDVEIVRDFFNFVSNDISHTFDIGANEVTCKASEVLKYGHGICYAKSHLLAALLRSSGIPAGFCYQRLESTDSIYGFVLHGLNAVFFKDTGTWVRIDARGKVGAQVIFDLGQDMLAFKVDKSIGESEDLRVYPKPAQSAINALMQSTSAEELARKLPDNI
jgi:hypothetical protein